jgi:hypothetical protein
MPHPRMWREGGTVRWASWRQRSAVLTIAISLAMVSCSNGSVGPDVANLVSDQPGYAVYQKDSVRIIVRATTSTGAAVHTPRLTYRVADPRLLEVAPNGVARSLGPAGLTRVSVSGGGVSINRDVWILQAAASLTITPSSLTFGFHESAQVTFNVRDRLGNPMHVPDWFKGPPAIDELAALDVATGVVTAWEIPGTTQLQVRAVPDVFATLTVTVVQRAATAAAR